jgi:hypothetical protein
MASSLEEGLNTDLDPQVLPIQFQQQTAKAQAQVLAATTDGTPSSIGQQLLTATSSGQARSIIDAAEAGDNNDITTLNDLTGSTGWSAWTGTPSKATQATYSGTASVLYTQAELQGAMNALQDTTETMMALIQTLLDSGVLQP